MNPSSQLAQQRAKALAAGYTDDEINQFLGMRTPMAQSVPVAQAQLKKHGSMYKGAQTAKGRGGTATSLISEGGALGGAALGASIGSVVPILGTAIGGIIGGGIGAFGGRLAENQVRDSRWGLADAAKEGAITTALSGPLRLAKYGSTLAKGAKAGVGLENALINAADDAAKFSLRGTIGKGVLGKADDLAVKQFRLTPTQLKNYKAKFGEDAGQTIRKYGFTSAQDVAEKGINPLQQQFDDAVTGITGVTKDRLQKNLNTRIAKLANSGATDNQALAKQLQKESDQLLSRYGDVIDAKELNAIRREFDSLVNYTDRMANPARYGVNKRMADALRVTLQESDNTGTLKNVGRELQKVRQLSDAALKQEQLGRGSLPFNLPTLLGGTMGAAAGGPVTAVGSAVATAAANSPLGRRTTMKAAEKVGGQLVNKGGQNGIWDAMMGATRAQAAEGLMSNLQQPTLEGAVLDQYGLGQQLNNYSLDSNAINPTMPPSASPMSNASNMPASNNMDSLYSQDASMGNSYTQPQTQNPYPKENLVYDVQRDPANAQDYFKLYQQYAEIFANEEPVDPMADMSQSSKNALASSDNAINTVDQLQQLYTNAGSGSGRIGGTIKGWAANAGLDENAKVYNSLANASVTQIAKALAGSGAGTVSDMDAKVIMAALPTLRDTPMEAATKFAALRQRLDNAKQNTLLYGSGGGSLEDAILQSQGAYY